MANFFNGVYKQPMGTTILLDSVRDDGHMFHEKRTPSLSSAWTKSQPLIITKYVPVVESSCPNYNFFTCGRATNFSKRERIIRRLLIPSGTLVGIGGG